jgi:DNA primase
MRDLLDEARPLIDRLWDQELAIASTDTPERRAGFRQRLRERIRQIGERSVYEDYRSEVDRRLAAAFDRPPTRGRPLTPQKGRPGAAEVGGMAARAGTQGLERQPEEVVLALLVNHPHLALQHEEELVQARFRASGLDKLRNEIIKHAAGHPELDSETLKRHLTEVGYAQALQGLLDRTKDKRFTLPAAPAERAAEGLREQLGLMRERAAYLERDAAARRLGEEPSEGAHAQFVMVRQATLDGESRRADVDGVDTGTAGARSPRVGGSRSGV